MGKYKPKPKRKMSRKEQVGDGGSGPKKKLKFKNSLTSKVTENPSKHEDIKPAIINSCAKEVKQTLLLKKKKLVYTTSTDKQNVMKLTKWFPEAGSKILGRFFNVSHRTIRRIQHSLVKRRLLSKDLLCSKTNRKALKLGNRLPTEVEEVYGDDLILMREFEEFLNQDKLQKPPRKHPVTNDVNIQKFVEVLKLDPEITLDEAAVAVGVSKATVIKMRKIIKSRDLLNANKSELKLPHYDPGDTVSGEVGADFFDDFDDEPSNANWEDTKLSIPQPRPLKRSRSRKIIMMKFKPFIINEETRCLVCFERYGSRAEGKVSGFTSPWGIPRLPISSFPETGELSENLRILFLLTKIFEISTSELTPIMEEADGMSMREWIIMCDKCQETVKEAMDIQVQIQKLEEKLFRCKQEILKWIKKPTERRRVSGSLVKSKEQILAHKVREVASVRLKKNGKKAVSKASIYDGDQQAESLLRLKVEPEFETVMGDGGAYQENYNDDCDETMETETDQSRLNPPIVGMDDLDPVAKAGEERHKDSNPEFKWSTILPESEMSAPDAIPSLPNLQDMKTLDNPSEANRSNVQLEPKLMICDVCGEEMRFGALALHKLREHGATEGYKTLKCPKDGCKYVTLFQRNFKTHLQTHESLRKFTCQYCGRAFKSAKNLKQHEDIHKNADTKPYRCEICGASYAVKYYMYWHMGQAHNMKFSYVSGKKRCFRDPIFKSS